MVRVGRQRLHEILTESGITFQRTKTWKESNDPQRDAKLDRIEHVTDKHPDRVFAFEGFGPLAIRPTGGACWAPRSRPQRLRANYNKLHGVRQFHGCYSVGDDELWGVVRRRKSAANTLAALKTIRARRPDGERVYVILDNLSAHNRTDIARWAKRNKVELCFTPTYSSWANPIEAHFGPLREFVPDNSDHPNHTVLTRRAARLPALAQRQQTLTRTAHSPTTRTSQNPSRKTTPLGQTHQSSRMTKARKRLRTQQ